jgi:hypothetical protein
MLSEVPVLDQFAFRIQFVDDRVCVPIIACSEHRHLIFSIDGLQALFQVRPHKALIQERLVSIWLQQLHSNVRLHITILVQLVILVFEFICVSKRMDQRLIKVKNKQLVKTRLLKLKVDFFMLRDRRELL